MPEPLQQLGYETVESEPQRRTKLVFETIAFAHKQGWPIGPTAIASAINEDWCMGGGNPQSSAIMPYLRKLLTRRLVVGAGRGKYRPAE